ncbi:ArsR/SmtB family transcription factor [Devosia beringensis]|uniref:ArsR/SmtB family transcription factor n=1 Tax=Devosia beringensis TaxID=2657486 RepID=UPI00186B9B2D|nr:metalloregulator ArsR/SmtB family transcription factor [Devosia beringensis]
MPPIAILVALADPTRCRLIELLQGGPQPVHVLAAAFRISRPAISRHLRVLKQSGLISEKKFGRENRYALHPGKLAPVQRWLAGLLPAARITEAPAVVIPAVEQPLPKARRIPKPAATPVILVPALAAEAAAPAPAKPAVSQMGFDF